MLSKLIQSIIVYKISIFIIYCTIYDLFITINKHVFLYVGMCLRKWNSWNEFIYSKIFKYIIFILYLYLKYSHNNYELV